MALHRPSDVIHRGSSFRLQLREPTAACNEITTLAVSDGLAASKATKPRVRARHLALPLLAAVLALGAGSSGAGRIAYPGQNGAIVFQRSGNLWTIRPDGSGLNRLTQTGNGYFNPAWSPDGKKIAFDDGGAIYVMDANGSSRVNLSAVPDPDVLTCDSEPTWSPDGKQIAFSTTTDDCTGYAGQIDAMKADGTGRHVIEDDYAGLLGGDTQPAWAPGGGQIVFTRSTSARMASGPYEYDIWILDTRTGKALRALRQNGIAPSWRPNGQQIAYGGDGSIAVMTAAGKSPRFLVRGASPAWSPDAGQIVYAGAGGLHIVRTNGSRADRLLLRCSCRTPDWQPLPK